MDLPGPPDQRNVFEGQVLALLGDLYATARRLTRNQADAEDSPADSARLLTTQMAVAGSSRAEIESRLRIDFGIQDPAPLLDAILGQEE